ncbi:MULTISPECIES: hypothetical protein [Candidatus Ichthyocystis]|uniref:Putative coiled coil protein n=1 Tax=Candidatus Ichthyocystis hellenicum TaxID=1561003 RepID=A0A0S4M8G7_9BURK|nr:MULTISPECIES: hypothetical protein [Ichthyocystis]CUT17684.1 putative coiled coil protein [Candidatus Ichthyocystis hellenicum]
MYNINASGNSNGVNQVGSHGLPVEIGDTRALQLEVVSCPYPITSTFSAIDTVDGFSLSNKLLLQDLCIDYEHSIDIEVISKICDDDFFQEYAVKNGYILTKHFLSVMNRHKLYFVDKINSILVSLSSSFRFFLKNLENSNKTINEICCNEVCCFFSKNAYKLVPKCINFLQSNVVPATISSIFESKVVDGDCDREMTYSEMEELFLYFVSSLEKLIMLKIMKYWHDFCNKSDSLLPLIAGPSYSNPFICASNFDGISVIKFICPASFSNKFGKYISFMAVSRIEVIMHNFIVKCNYVLKEMVRTKCSYIRDCSKAYYKFNELRYKFKVLVKEEFDKKIIEEGIEYKLSNFLKNVVIWDKQEDIEINRLLIFNRIIEHMRNLLMSTVTRDVYSIIKCFQEKFLLFKNLSVTHGENLTVVKRSLMGSRFLDAIEYRWGLRLHPEDDKLILFIRRKFSIQIRDNLTALFSDMLKSGYVLPSGRVLRNCFWVFVSDELLPIAIKSLESIIADQHEELDRVLSEARIANFNEKDLSSYVIRGITENEKNDLILRARKIVDKRIKVSARLSWGYVVSNFSNRIVYSYKDMHQDVNGIVIAERLGVKLRRVDIVAISNARKRFLPKIKTILYDKLSNIVKNRHEFDLSASINDFTWIKVSKRLLGIAKSEVRHIIEDEMEELEEIIFRSRVVVDCKVDRDLTDEEIYFAMLNVVRLVFNALKSLLKKVWDDVVGSSGSDLTDDKVSNVGADSDVVCVGDNSSSLNGSGGMEVCYNDKNGDFIVKICYEDDFAISYVKKRFLCEINNRISKKYREIMRKEFGFIGGDTTISMYSWRSVSKKVLPVIKKEIDPIIENERAEISCILSNSSVYVYPLGVFGGKRLTRKLTQYEISMVLVTIMDSVSKQVIRNFSRIWNKVIKLSSVGLRDIKDEYRFEIDNIRVEFIGSLGPIVDEVVGSLSPDVMLTCLSNVIFTVSSIVLVRSHNLFNNGGFLKRLELLLSSARIVDLSGDGRFITDKEKEVVLREFMDMIDSDIEFLIRGRISKWRDLFLSSV